MVQLFVDLNDRKKRADYEMSSGGDPIKAFFVEVSNLCNDSLLNHELAVVVSSKEDEDQHLYDWVNGSQLRHEGLI